uniref:Uncharacterized protein n=1 Tax=Anguilla anguilla TaxID=7936 RepID=A0A0E9UQ01_ANGAN
MQTKKPVCVGHFKRTSVNPMEL